MSSFLSDIFFPVIRAGMDMDAVDAAPIKLTERDCETLRRLGLRQDIIPIIYRGIKKLDVEDAWIEKLEDNKTKCMYRFVLREDTLKTVCEVLEKAGIDYIILKGGTIKKLYPKEWMRTSLDIDILVREEDVENAVDALEKNTDYKAESKTYHDISLVNKVIQLELHFNLKEGLENTDNLLDKAWSYANPSGEGRRYEFTPEYMIFYVVAHMSYHMIHGGVGVRSFIDLWLLKNKMEYDEEAVRQMCESCNILKFYEVCCDVMAVWFEGADRSLPKGLERYCLSGGAYGDEEQFIKVYQREKQGTGYVMHRIFASGSILKKDYPVLYKRPYLMPFYQVKRWTRLFDKKLYKSVKRELKVVKSTERDNVTDFDNMLKDMGL